MFKVRSIVSERFYENFFGLFHLNIFENLELKIQKTVDQVLLILRSPTLLFHFAVFILNSGIVRLKSWYFAFLHSWKLQVLKFQKR